MPEESDVSNISIDAWADGPDTFGQWRGCWRLLRDGLAICERFGVTGERFSNEDLAICAAIIGATSDKRNALNSEAVPPKYYY